MKKINLLILITVISAVLVGCVDSNNNDKKKDHTLFDLNAVVSITVQNDSGGFITITDSELMERFDEAIHTAEYDNAQLDIVPPNYVAAVQLKNSKNETFSFWIKGEHEGLFIKPGRNGHYRLTGIAKTDLLHLFQSDEQ